MKHLIPTCVALATLAPASAAAQSVACDGLGDFPCSFQLRDVEIQPVPAVLKFQTRVSQAKLPIGEGEFRRVVVNLRRGSEVLCREEFEGVKVIQSVLNLEIGRNMSCELDQVIAENESLSFQVCIGGDQNCLRPIALGTMPYAFKSSYAAQAQEAHHADIAAQAHYAQRLSADRELFVRKQLGVGFFDFHTHSSAPLLYPDAADFAPYANGGFLQWSPVNEAQPTLHISARDHEQDTPAPLSELVLFSDATRATGTLRVQGETTIGGDTRMLASAEVASGLTVHSGGATVTGASSIDGNTQIIGAVEVLAGADGSGLHVVGDSDIEGHLTVTNGITVDAGGVQVTGDSSIDGALQVTGALSATSGAVVQGAVQIGQVPGEHQMTVNHTTVFIDEVTFNGRVAFADLELGGLLPRSGGTVDGDLTIQGNLDAGSISGIRVERQNCFEVRRAIGRSPACPNNSFSAGTFFDFTYCCEPVLFTANNNPVPPVPVDPLSPGPVRRLFVPFNSCFDPAGGDFVPSEPDDVCPESHQLFVGQVDNGAPGFRFGETSHSDVPLAWIHLGIAFPYLSCQDAADQGYPFLADEIGESRVVALRGTAFITDGVGAVPRQWKLSAGSSSDTGVLLVWQELCR